MTDLILRAMVRGMWKDARNCAMQGKPGHNQYSNRRDFACNYTSGFFMAHRISLSQLTAHCLNKVAEHRRRGNYYGARQWLGSIRQLREDFSK